MHKNISYVKVSINMQFQKSYFQILKTLTSDEINNLNTSKLLIFIK